MRVALFATCLGDQFFDEACADAVRLLRHLGVEVDFPEGQTCCGQPAHNSGNARDARRMAEHTLDDLQPLSLLDQLGGAGVAQLVEGVARLAGGVGAAV